ATFGPCLRAALSTCLRCFGGRRRQTSHAVSARPIGPNRRERGRRGTGLYSQAGLVLAAVLVLAVPVTMPLPARIVLLPAGWRRRRRLCCHRLLGIRGFRSIVLLPAVPLRLALPVRRASTGCRRALSRRGESRGLRRGHGCGRREGPCVGLGRLRRRGNR